jgi:hypothetical protein
MAEPVTLLMKSRRRIAFPEARDHADCDRLQQGIATGEMGSGVSLHGSNPEPLTPAWAQKGTFQRFRIMSALLPKADTGLARRDARYVPKADVRRSLGLSTLLTAQAWQ